jgi:hypothetical protein
MLAPSTIASSVKNIDDGLFENFHYQDLLGFSGDEDVHE